MASKKKVAPKVVLKHSTESEPVICTTNDVARFHSLGKKTTLSCYQNTSDVSNPRVSDQRMLIMDSDGVQSVGKSWETKTYGCQYMIGVLDRNSNEMTLRSTKLINMKPYVRAFKEDVRKELTYGQKHKEVMMAFGGSKIRKSITGKDRIRDMESNTLDEAMEEAVVSADKANLTQKSDIQHNDILPPMNINATVLEDVFIITDLISEAELLALLPFTKVLLGCTNMHVDAWRQQQRYPEFMLSRLPITMDDEEMAHLYLSKLLYISYLVTMLKLPQKQLKNRKGNFPHTPTVVTDNIYKKFTSQGQVDGQVRTSISDKQRNKLLCHTLALTLLVDNFCVPFTSLCKDMGVKQRVLGDTYRSMGCVINKLKGTDGNVNYNAILKLPFKLPDVVIRKGRTKSRQ